MSCPWVPTFSSMGFLGPWGSRLLPIGRINRGMRSLIYKLSSLVPSPYPSPGLCDDTVLGPWGM